MSNPIISELETNTHLFFLRGVFSNFASTTQLEYDGIKFNSTEQAFMYAKAKLFNDTTSMIAIVREKRPAQAKQLGRGVQGFDPVIWDKHKYQLMLDVNLCKYTQFENYRNYIINTGDKILVEANGKPDLIWSCGLYANDPRITDNSKWPGENLLGKVLMEIRSMLKDHKHE